VTIRGAVWFSSDLASNCCPSSLRRSASLKKSGLGTADLLTEVFQLRRKEALFIYAHRVMIVEKGCDPRGQLSQMDAPRRAGCGLRQAWHAAFHN